MIFVTLKEITTHAFSYPHNHAFCGLFLLGLSLILWHWHLISWSVIHSWSKSELRTLHKQTEKKSIRQEDRRVWEQLKFALKAFKLSLYFLYCLLLFNIYIYIVWLIWLFYYKCIKKHTIHVVFTSNRWFDPFMKTVVNYGSVYVLK